MTRLPRDQTSMPPAGGRDGCGQTCGRGFRVFVLGAVLSFLYFRLWTLFAFEVDALFWRKWMLGLVRDVLACGVFLALVRACLGRIPTGLVRTFALGVVLLNWANFEFREHVGQPFLPQILSVIPLEEANTEYGRGVALDLLEPRDIGLGFALPAALVAAARLDLPPLSFPVALRCLAGTLALGGTCIGVMCSLWANVTGFPRTLTWCFYRHGAPQWLAYLVDDDDVVIGNYDVSPLGPDEHRRLQGALASRARTARATPAFFVSSRPGGRMAQRPLGRSKNVLMIHLESFRAASFDGLGDTWRGITPRLSALMGQGAYFTRAFTNALPSDRSLTSMFCSVPVPDAALSKMHRPRPRLTCLTDLLAENGYRVARMTGIPESFQRLGEFFSSHGVQESYGSHELDQRFPHPLHEPLPESGYDPRHRYDERVFHAAKTWLDEHVHDERRPFFLLLETMTNHLPWELPEGGVHPLHEIHSLDIGAAETGSEETTRMHRTMRLTDDYVADFVEWFRKLDRGRVMDETVIIVYSDHPPWFSEPEFVRYDRAIKESWIPLFFLGLPPEMNGEYDHPVSLMDVAPTLVELLELSGAHAFVGQPLFDAGRPRWFTFSRPGEGRVFLADGEELTLQDGRRFRLKLDVTLEPLADDAPSSVDDWALLERFVMHEVVVERRLLPQQDLAPGRRLLAR